MINALQKLNKAIKERNGGAAPPTKAKLHRPNRTKHFQYITAFILCTMLFASTSGTAQATDVYRNFAELQANEPETNYNILAIDRTSPVLILAPHGGSIEGGTSELARELSNDYSTYLFESLKTPGGSDLHITSTHFDEPTARDVVPRHQRVISLHGYSDSSEHIIVGGTDPIRGQALVDRLNAAGFSAELVGVGHRFAGVSSENIANKCITGESLQIEISTGLRKSMFGKFSLIGRAGTENVTFYKFTGLLSEFINENYNVGGIE
ncbi:poly-gamma-glutamate hydrolase family protein [Bacillus sp. L381]|uniref:poly-gamma-glutamate hydrolase family protein n=1 Tax=Bacillus TaxID=1386 RepID=UPI001BAC1DC8|nr:MULTISPECIES: poly-gamma-glutamate hydrolase family protein [Bacillus]MCR9040846.1 poly-gamma-glutamate hydrolase family protein [Bacillus velezensis]QUN08734.1 poly-gamma-glutamate hydrolase family protein [Bacillus amyloliquefaciens]QYM81806.1 poly-gamma-glutamate hydrolase family protein [Bacillus sp. 7D3]QZY10952.1 poly-gamma-glutamate hydrolase family protein [Bacillus amyloliquefaciens]WIX20852.1 poly-gamma-glutamate hydrolase family protein [Bacillus sp. L381]